MEKFKIEILKKEKPTMELGYIQLNVNDCQSIFDSILNLTGAKEFTKNQDLYLYFRDNLSKSISIDNIDSKKKFKRLLEIVGIDKSKDNENVFILWRFPDNIDVINQSILIKHWEFIWYGESDDAVLLYWKESRFLMLITHFGDISYDYI